jgi:hypothetical protein
VATDLRERQREKQFARKTATDSGMQIVTRELPSKADSWNSITLDGVSNAIIERSLQLRKTEGGRIVTAAGMTMDRRLVPENAAGRMLSSREVRSKITSYGASEVNSGRFVKDDGIQPGDGQPQKDWSISMNPLFTRILRASIDDLVGDLRIFLKGMALQRTDD